MNPLTRGWCVAAVSTVQQKDTWPYLPYCDNGAGFPNSYPDNEYSPEKAGTGVCHIAVPILHLRSGCGLFGVFVYLLVRRIRSGVFFFF